MSILQQPRNIAIAGVVIAALVFIGLLLWRLGSVLALVFGAILVAVILRSLARPFERWLRMKAAWSVLLVCLLIGGAIGGFLYLLGAQLSGEFSSIAQQVQQQIQTLGERLGIPDLGQAIRERARAAADKGSILQQVAGFTSTVFGGIADLFIVLVAGIYLAISPEVYRGGFLMLMPGIWRQKVDIALDKAGGALRLWLLGQFIAMLLVGILTTAGLYLIGVKSALALGVFAGLIEFVPFIGPFVGGAAAMLVALGQGGNTVWWVLLLFVVIQQIENNVVVPLVQRRTVELPPVVLIFAVVVFGILFQFPGILLGAPLAVVAMVLIKQLYVRDLLNEPVQVPGDGKSRSG